MYELKMIENENDLVCKMKHKQPISMVVLDSKISQNERLLCQQCIDDFEIYAKIIGFKKLINVIEDKKQNSLTILENLIKQNLQSIESFQAQIFNLKTFLVQQLDHLINNTNDWILDLQSTCSKFSQYSFYQELDLIILNQQSTQSNQINLNNQIKLVNDAWNTKVYSKLELFKSFEEYQQCDDILRNLTNQSYEQQQIQSNLIINQNINQDKEQNKQLTNNEIIQQQLQSLSPNKIQFINNSIKQDEWCLTIVFDRAGKIMVSGSGKDINIWNIKDGKINQTHSLNGHSNNVSFLVYSQIQNYFISGSDDYSIRMWKYQNNNEWQSSKSYNEHKNWISCIILTQKEDQLISCGADNSIKVWMIDFNNNELKLQYSLEKHTDFVYSLSLNQSERVLVSCGKGQIIIWKKQQNNQWQFQYVVIVIENVSFLEDEDQFIWLSAESKNICIFEFTDDGQYQENIEKRVQFQQKGNEGNYNYYLFPIIYNKEQNLICLRHLQHIYIFKLQNNGFLSIVEQLDCQDQHIYGTISNNGQYLVYWGEKKKKLETYEILYK